MRASESRHQRTARRALSCAAYFTVAACGSRSGVAVDDNGLRQPDAVVACSTSARKLETSGTESVYAGPHNIVWAAHDWQGMFGYTLNGLSLWDNAVRPVAPQQGTWSVAVSEDRVFWYETSLHDTSREAQFSGIRASTIRALDLRTGEMTQVYRVPRPSVAPFLIYMVLFNEYLYFAGDKERLFRVPVAGGRAEPVADPRIVIVETGAVQIGGELELLGVDSGLAYISAAVCSVVVGGKPDCGVYRAIVGISLDTGEAKALTEPIFSSVPRAAGESHVVWTEIRTTPDPYSQDGRIIALDVPTRTRIDLAPLSDWQQTVLKIDRGEVFFADGRTSISKVSLAGGPVSELWNDPQDQVFDLAADGLCVYWASGKGVFTLRR